MNQLNLDEVRQYVNNNIDTFHGNRLTALATTRLASIVNKNPYLSRAKNVTRASELVEGALTAKLSSSEEELFGMFLEDLAIFVAEQTTSGHKSGANGIDLEFDNEGWHYFVSIKSGVNWGNKSQQDAQELAFATALRVFRQRQGQRTQTDAILGISYGNTRTNRVRGALKLVGQNFWTFISGNRELYKEIIEPIGYMAKEHNEAYEQARGNITNVLTHQFIQTYCHPDGSIDWNRLVEATCGNFDLDLHGFNF